jgi:hypothetical protein
MGTKTDQQETIAIGVTIDQHQVRLDVTVTVIFPLAGKRMVSIARGQGLVVGQEGENGWQIQVERSTVWPPAFSLEVLPESSGPVNLPHGDQP